MEESKKNDLRVKAEKILRQRGIDNSEYNKESLEKLIEELNIYQIELEHQNDELKRTQQDLERKNEKFADLYNNAPVSYFTVDQDYVIVNVNHKGAELFGIDFKKLINTKFTDYIHHEFQDIYYYHHRRVLNEQKPDSCEIKIITKNDHVFHIRLESIPTKEFQTNKVVLRTAIIDITSEKKIEEENHRRLHILKNISDSVIVTNLEGKITYWNQGAKEIFGYSEKEMLGKTPAKLYPDMDPKKLNYDLEKIKAGNDYIGEWKGKKKNGEMVWVNIRTSALFDQNNKLVGFLGVAKDVTKEKLLAEKIKVEAERTKAYFELSGYMMLVLDNEGNIADINKAGCKTLGCKEKEFVGQSWVKNFIPDYLQEDNELGIKKILNDQIKGPQYHESFIRDKKGGEKLMAWNYTTLKDAGGKVIGLLAAGEDITDRKQKEIYKTQLASIVEYSEDGIESMDIDGYILSWNKGAEKIYGYKASEIVGKNAIQLYPEDQKTELKSAISKIKNGESVSILETKRQRKNGKTIDVSISFSPLKNSKDKVIGISVITRDITEQKKNKRVLQETELKYQTIFEESGNAILIMSKNKIISCNNTLTQLFGYNKKEIIGKSPIYFSPEYQFEDVTSEKLGTEYIQKAFKTGYVSFEWKHMNKNGKVLNTYISLKKVEINGKPFLISILHDLTEIREYQFKLKEKNEEFLAQNEEYRVLNEELHEKNQQLYEINAQLEYSEKKFRSAFKTSPDAVNINRMSDGLYIDINKGFTKLTGFTEEDVEGKTSEDIDIWVHKEDREKLVKRLKKDGYVENLESEFRTKDGRITTALMSATILQIDGEPCILSMTRDITELKKAEEKIRKLSKGIDQSPAICVITDIEGNIEYVNPRFTELTGYTAKEVIGENPRILKSDYHPKEFYTELWNTITSGRDFRCEMYNKKKNGEFYWESALISPIKDSKGLITNFIAIKEDISEKKRTEEQIRELNFRSSLANDAAQIGIWDLDLVQDEMVWDANMFKLYGVNPDNFQESYDAWKKALHKDDAQRAIQECEDALNNKGEFHPIFRIVRPDKTVRYIEAHAKVIYDKDGNALRMTGVNWDVTEKRLALEQIQKEEQRQRSILNLIQKNVDSTQEFLDLALNEAINLTESKIGYIYFYNEELKQFTLNSWSKEVMKECSLTDPQTCYELDKTGIWGEAVRQRKPIVINDYKAKNDLKKGYPKGHVNLKRFMTVPIFDGKRIVAAVGVGNKGTDYTKTDELQLNLLMDSVWKSAEAKRVQDELLRSEKKYRRLAENISDVIWTTDLEFNVTFVTPSIRRLTGDTVQQHTNKPVEKKIPAKYLKEIKQILKKELEKEGKTGVDKNRSVLFETPYYKADGSEIWVTMNVSFLRDDKGNVRGLQGVTHDITKRKKAEQENTNLATMVDIAPNAVLIHDFNGNILFTNERNLELHGYTREEFYQLKLKDIDVPESAALIKNRMDKISKHSEASFEVEHIRKDGTKFPLMIFAKKVDWYGRPAMLSIGTDITERRKAEAKLKAEHSNLEFLMQATGAHFNILDIDYNIVDVDLAWQKIYGDPQGRKCHEYFMGIEKPCHGCAVPKAFETKEITVSEEFLPVENKYFEVHTIPFQNEQGEWLCAEFNIDITERKKVALELQASLERNKAILEANPDLMFVFSDKGEIVDYKAEKDTELLIPPEAFLGKNVKEVLPDYLAALTFEKIEEVKLTGKMELYSYTLEIDTKPRFYESRLVPYGKDHFLAIVRDITQKQLDEINLRESKQKLKDAMKTASLGSWELDLIHNKLYWSEEMFTLFDVDETKVNPTYELFVEHIHSDDQKFVERSYKDSLKDKMPYEIKYRIITSRGKLKYVKEKRRSIFDNNGSPVKTVGVIQDISDLKRIELDLRKAKDRAEERQNYSKIIAELSKKVIEPELSVKEIGEIIYKHALKLTSSTVGYVSTIDTDSEDLVSHTLSEMMPGQCNVKDKKIAFPKGKDGYNGLYGHALNTKESFFTNNPDDHIASEGLPEGHVPLQNFLTVPVLVKNKLLGQIALANKPSPYDINDLRKIEDLANIYGMAIYRKNTEDELINAKERAESSEEKYQAFITQSSEGICRMELEKPLDPKMDVEKQIDFFYDYLYLAECNETFVKMYNAKSKDELINKKLIVFHGGRNNKVNRDTTRNVILNGYNIIGAISEEKTLDGKDIVFRTNVVGIFEEGKLVRMWETQTDVTEEMKLKKELIEAKEKAEESDRLKSAFLANMSHEIRTPMNAIRGFAQLLVEADFPKEKQQNFLNIINTRTQDLLVLIDDIIDISKIEANQLTIQDEEFLLDKMMSGLYSEKEAEVKKNPELDFKLELNPENNKLIISADRSRIKQILQNLISNALKFTKKGKIAYGYQVKANMLEFYVKDTGIGISKKSQEIIFERFRQVDGSSTRKFGGTGLGLNISKHIVNLMGGEIWVESEEGKGSIFYFTVPLKLAKKESNEPEQSEKYDWSSKNILIVEDDEVNLYYLCELLEFTNVNILTARNGEESLKLVKSNGKIDLVLLDINLPDISGNDVVKEIRTFNKKLTVIAQSAYSMKEEIKKSMEYGLTDYVTKPIDSTLLLSIIDKYLK
ncbi:MAG: PAS domain S-box protein [Bacteroidetes bacterium]|nr:PAS domain S-box protein [Bacteroidota bacterium]